MSTEIFVIGSGTHHMTYCAALVGYGYRVRDISTFEAARVMLRAGYTPSSIVIDMTAKAKEIDQFLHIVRDELALNTKVIVIGGSEERSVYERGAHVFFQRPVSLADLVHTVDNILQ